MIQELAKIPVLHQLTTEEAFERFLRLSVADGAASPKTLKAYRENFTAFLQYCALVNADARTATYDDIEAYRAYLVGAGLKRPTIKLRLVAVRALYTALQRWGVRPDNPAAGVKTPRDKEAPSSSILRKALSPHEVKTFLLGLPSSGAPQDLRDNAIIQLMLFQGLRAGEVAAANNYDITYPTFSSLRVWGKGDKARTIILGESAKRALILWGAGDGDGSRPLFYRFTTPGFVRLSVRDIERIVDHYLKKAGLKQKGRSAHSLRHSFAMLATMGGANREALADSLGHASLATTEIYTRAAAAFQNNPADAMVRALEGER